MIRHCRGASPLAAGGRTGLAEAQSSRSVAKGVWALSVSESVSASEAAGAAGRQRAI